MTPAPTAQLLLPLSGEDKTRPVVKPRKVKPHHRPKPDGALVPLIQPTLPVRDRYFLPLAGVPKTRAECPPPSEYCRHIRCRYHLAMIDAEHRAGRPGLAHVPRDARGWTVPVKGDAGRERPGTTFDPRWLELERRCRVWVERDEAGAFVSLHASYKGEADLFFERLHVGEPIDVLQGHVSDGEPMRASESHPLVTSARLTQPGALAIKGELDGMFFTLVRRRGVESCALHMIDRGGRLSNQEIGDGLGRHRTLVARESRNAARKVEARAEEMEIERDDLMRTLMQMGGASG